MQLTLSLQQPRLPLPRLHQPSLQQRRRLHARRRRVRFPHRPANHQLLHHTAAERHRDHFRGCRVGSRGHDARAPAAVPEHGQGVPSRPAGHSRLDVRLLEMGRRNYGRSRRLEASDDEGFISFCLLWSLREYPVGMEGVAFWSLLAVRVFGVVAMFSLVVMF
jgi:hypothetical protein